MRFVAVVGALMLTSVTSPTWAFEFGTRAEAVEMVKRVLAKIKKDGLEATCRAINTGAKEFHDRDLYPVVVDLQGNNYANGGTPTVVGKNIIDLKDQDGKFLIRDSIALVKAQGSGWLDTRWPNPVTKTIEDKSIYLERFGDNYFTGVGIYKNEQPNENTVGLISGSLNSDDTYLQMAHDLAEVLNDGDNLRILPIVGIGGARNIRDVRYVRGVDIGLTQTNILNNFRRSNERMGQFDNKIVYIAKLFNEEVHLVAKLNITSIEQLRGLKVNLDTKGGGTSYSMRDLFKALQIEVEEVSMSQTEALEKVKSGEIAATALIAGKPVRSISKLTHMDRLHFVSIPYSTQLIGDYLPATLTNGDYPEFMSAGETVDTVAVGAVLIAYNWSKTNGDRYRRVQRFVEAFFPKIAEFQKPPRHQKWREVNIATTLPGWTRFDAAQTWLDNHRQEQQRNNGEPMTVEQAGARQAPAPGGSRSASSAEQLRQSADPALYQEFLKWRQQRGQ
jgi:TRAP-type uncharacterized transport system substrate-binding protein